MNVIKESVLLTSPREKPLFDVGSAAHNHLNKHIEDILSAYTKCLKNLAFSHDDQVIKVFFNTPIIFESK